MEEKQKVFKALAQEFYDRLVKGETFESMKEEIFRRTREWVEKFKDNAV